MLEAPPLSSPEVALERLPLFRSAADTLRTNIDEGNLSPGLVLLEGPIAGVLNMSRSSVKRALALLELEGVVRRFEGRGYIVGREGQILEPVRADLAKLNWTIEDAARDAPGRVNWKRVHDRLEGDISSTLVFGRYRLVENDLADHFAVSRTVIRDVLGRLQERGLVSKSSTSRWFTVPLTARSVRNKYELRVILEVASLRSAAPYVDRPALRALSTRMERIEGQADTVPHDIWFEMIDGFAALAVLPSPNADVRRLVASNQKMLRSSKRALFALGLPAEASSIRELRMIAELILAGAEDSAARMLETHLVKACERTIAQLKIVAVLPEPDHLEPYLNPA